MKTQISNFGIRPMLFAAVLPLLFVADLNGQGLNWAEQFTANMLIDVNASVVDAQGNIYVVGEFEGTADLDPGPGVLSVGPSYGTDIWFGKYGPTGNLIWAHALIGGSDDEGKDIAIDNSGNIYITGSFGSGEPLDFDPAHSGKYLTPGWGMYVASYTANGAYRWARSIGSDPQSQQASIIGYGIALTSNGGALYVTGSMGTDNIDFNPPNNVTLNASNGQIFLASYQTSNGAYNNVALNIVNASSGGIGYDIAIDASNNIYISGQYYGSATKFNGSSTTFNSANGAAFVVKYNSSLGYQWAYTVPGGANDYASGVTTDGTNAYIIGTSYTSTSIQGFFYKYTSTGKAWSATIPSATGQAITINGAFLYLSGMLYGNGTSINLDPNANTPHNINLPLGRTDFYIGKYSLTQGIALGGGWVQNLNMTLSPNGNDVSPSSIRVTSGGKVVLAGAFAGSGNFTSCASATSLSAPNTYGFIGSYNDVDPAIITGPANVCSSGGPYTFTMTSPAGASFSWVLTESPSGILQGPTSGTGNSVTLTAVSGTSGSATITFTVTGACGTNSSLNVPLQIWVGHPNSPLSLNKDINNPPFCVGATVIASINPVGGASTYTWVSNNPSMLEVSGSGNYVNLLADAAGTCTFSVTTANACGSTSKNYIASLTDCSGGGQMSVTAYPNPSSSTMTVSVTDSVATSNSVVLPQPYQLNLYDRFGASTYSVQSDQHTLQIPVGSLPQGVYYINVLYKDAVLRRQVFVQH